MSAKKNSTAARAAHTFRHEAHGSAHVSFATVLAVAPFYDALWEEVMKSYSLTLGISNAILVVTCVSVFLAFSRDYTNFVILGPSKTIVFAGFVIDTWTRWTAVMLFSIVSQVSICINVNTLEPFITNVVRDHKATRVMSNVHGHIIVQLKTSYDWILGILNTNLWVTLQVQFLLTALVTDLIVTGIMTDRFLRQKKSHVLLENV